VIRCDDVLVDTDASRFAKMCRIIRRHDFDHLIGVTPLGEGRKMWAREKSVRGIHVSKVAFFDNFRARILLGTKCIEDNERLIELINTELDKPGAILALHGFHHYRYDAISARKASIELSNGIELLSKLFNRRVTVFIPPFNCWSQQTELVCKSLNLSIDKCSVGFDRRIQNMSNEEIVQLAKDQSSEPEVYYHPYRVLELDKFELYLQTRRKYS